MNKALSVRLEESVLRRLGAVSRKLGITKKAVIERAIEMYAEEAEHGLIGSLEFGAQGQTRRHGQAASGDAVRAVEMVFAATEVLAAAAAPAGAR